MHYVRKQHRLSHMYLESVECGVRRLQSAPAEHVKTASDASRSDNTHPLHLCGCCGNAHATDATDAGR